LIDAIVTAKAVGASTEALAPALALQRKAQWRLDFIAAENSMGFHAPQEAARILGEALDDARQGQIAAIRAQSGAPPATTTAAATDPAAPAGAKAGAPNQPKPAAPPKPAAAPAAPAAPPPG